MHISEAIPALKVSPAESPITAPRPNVSWNAKWLKLNTDSHPRLRDMEREVGQFCFDMWRAPEVGRLLVLAGTNGTGKTHCARAVMRWIQTVGHGKQWIPKPDVIACLQCGYWHWPGLLDRLKAGEWDLIAELFEVPCLIIDELGGGHDPSRVGVDKLCQILSKREKMWTLVTTNILPEAWAQIFDQRIASRLFRNSTLVDLSGVPDFNV